MTRDASTNVLAASNSKPPIYTADFQSLRRVEYLLLSSGVRHSIYTGRGIVRLEIRSCTLHRRASHLSSQKATPSPLYSSQKATPSPLYSNLRRSIRSMHRRPSDDSFSSPPPLMSATALTSTERSALIEKTSFRSLDVSVHMWKSVVEDSPSSRY